MTIVPISDYSHLDRPEILMRLFHPRPEYRGREKPENAIDLLIPVEGDIVVGGRFHLKSKSAPNILFFHANGEIVADYDQMGPLYNRIGVNFLPVDYRGYGRRALPIHPNWAEIEEIASEELARGFYGGTDVYDAMQRAVQRTEEYFLVK